MVKESVLFVASTALLVYFVTPVDEPPEVEPAVEEVKNPVADVSAAPDDGWDYDDESTDDGTFVFGEPLVYSDGGDEAGAAIDEEEAGADRSQSAAKAPRLAAPTTRTSRQPSSGSPGPSEKGGVDNPIIFETRTPANPVDD